MSDAKPTSYAASAVSLGATAPQQQQQLHPPLTVGKTRIRDKAGCVGTVVYIGTVASAKDTAEIYAGVVWDDVHRGRHDGSVICRRTGELVRHFTAPHPTAGSFLRLKTIDTGVSLTPELLKDRYVDLHSAECVAPNNLLPHTANTASGRNDKPIEFYGELLIRSQQQLTDLTSISMRRMGISSFAAAEDWSSLQHLTDMDLAGNLLSDWLDVSALLHGLPCLTKLSLAGNRLGDAPVDIVLADNNSSLCYLNLNQCGIQSVSTILWLGRALPSLKELALAHNVLSDLSADCRTTLAESLSHLTFLDCSSCQLTAEQVAAFSRLPLLESLSLDDNPIDKWVIRDKIDFANLKHLQLAGTEFEDWSDLRALNDLPNLISLRLRSCPVLSQLGAGEARSLMIGNFPGLQLLNASRITTTERRDAAYRYVQVVRRLLLMTSSKKQDDPDGSSKKQILTKYPQYEYWLEQYPELSERSAAQSGNNGQQQYHLMDSVINVTIRSMAASSCTMDPLIRRLPAQLTVGRLKALCARQFGLDVDLQTLHFKTDATDSFPTLMDDNHHTLSYYAVPDGAEILMNEVDLESIEKEEERAAMEFKQRIEQQEREMDDFQDRQKRLEGTVSCSIDQQTN